MNPKLILWLAQGLGIGRAPFSPGTFGSVLGLGWLAVLLTPENAWVLGVGIALGIGASVWLCDQGEKILSRTDPPSVVMDEVAAIPLCFAGWMAVSKHGIMGPRELFTEHWVAVLVIFGLFRLFDIAKPWPINSSQRLPGGIGITIDDVLAAIYVNIVTLLATAIF